MVNHIKETAHLLARALEAYGVTDVFSSPGSRDTPLIVAFNRSEGLSVSPVIDERSAAFIALGNGLISQRPVALVCTSGTALLNYAPAVAEAYYRKIPLIIISADRPAHWIGQDDSQTLVQPGALANFVKKSYNIKGEIDNEHERWLVNRTLNEALQTAINGRRGPIHINISFDEPLSSDEPADFKSTFKKIDLCLPSPKLDVEDAKILAAEALTENILIVGGFCHPSDEMNHAFAKIVNLPNVTVVADALANLNVDGVLSKPDLFIDSELLNKPESRPTMLITFGGSLLSKKLKEFLRNNNISSHWHVGANDSVIDSYFSLTRRIEIDECNFFPRFANALEQVTHSDNYSDQKDSSLYKALWQEAAFRAEEAITTNYISSESDGLTDRQAIHSILSALPKEWNLQLSNGLTPRLAVIGNACRFHRRDCNRGVSGIDGSVSTALGASLPYNGTTVLLTGDMSMQYDIAALSSPLLSPKLKIVVINNGGGGIFRKIASTKSLPELDKYFVCELRLPLKQLAAAYGLSYYKAESENELATALPEFIEESNNPALLEILTTDLK